MRIEYPQASEVIVAFVRTNMQRYEIRLVVDKGLAYMYFEDEMGLSYGKHSGYVMLADVLSDIGKLEAKTIKESELGINSR